MESEQSNLSKNLRIWRERKGVKIEIAAKEFGVSTSTWGHWETGRRFPAWPHLLSLSRHLDIPTRCLICFDSDKCNACPETTLTTPPPQ